MGQQFKANIARLKNLQKSQTLRKPTVEDVFDEEDMNSEQSDDLLNEGFFFLDEDDEMEGSDSDEFDSDDEEMTGGELDELRNEAHLEHFNAVLCEAQAIAVKAERNVNLIVIPSDTPIVLHALSARMGKAWPDRKLRGQTGSITVTEHCLQTLPPTSRKSMKNSMVQWTVIHNA